MTGVAGVVSSSLFRCSLPFSADEEGHSLVVKRDDATIKVLASTLDTVFTYRMTEDRAFIRVLLPFECRHRF